MNTESTHTETSNAAVTSEPVHATVRALDRMLMALAQRHPATPQWEFCEGMMVALLCMRRAAGEDEWLPALFGCEADEVFENPSERTRFLMLWLERQAQLRAELEASVEAAPEDGAPLFQPTVVDWRGALAGLPESERAAAAQGPDGPPPALARVWAQGFIFAVYAWEEDWRAPRDKDLARGINGALQRIGNLLHDDTGKPALNLYDENGPPSVSEQRLTAFEEALMAVHDLFDIARHLGPRVEPARRQNHVGRNDPCPCGSGKKYKKCCGQ